MQEKPVVELLMNQKGQLIKVKDFTSGPHDDKFVAIIESS